MHIDCQEVAPTWRWTSGTIDGVFAEVDLRPASPGEVDDVLVVLNDAARRLQATAIDQWPAAFEVAWIRPDILAGETWIARRAGVPVATITLGWTDPLWPDDELAGYVHRMARTSEAAGISNHLLQWADDRIREHGRRLPRLDCVASNSGLRGF